MRKLRWLGKNVQKVAMAVGAPVARLVRDWVVGSVASGSVVLSEIARTLRPDREGFEATLERLSRGLGKGNSEELAFVERAYLRRVRRWTTPTRFDVIAIDLSDIIKPYGRKMPFLCEVRDGSKSTRMKTVTGQGWGTVEIVAADARHRVLPLHRHAFSTVHPDYRSETNEVRKALEEISAFVQPSVLAVLDRGFDGTNEFALLDEYFEHWCVRQRGDRQVFLPGSDQPSRMETVARQLRTDERVEITCVRDGRLEQQEEHLGFCTVEVPHKACRVERRRPACELRGLIVVARRDPLRPPMMLLTSRPVRNATQARRWVHAYRRRWAVEEQTRVGKQGAELEDLRVLRWEAIQNLLRLSVVTEGLLALQQVEAPRRAKRLARLAPIDGDVPPFALYRIWMTVGLMLRGSLPASV
jgi:hypothetical protein